MSDRFSNLLHSLPNADDLSLIYSEERRQAAESSAAALRVREHRARLSLLFHCHWSEAVVMKLSSSFAGPAPSTSGGVGSGQGDWEECFLVVQDRRLVWWAREQDVDDGKPYLGQLMFGCDAHGIPLKTTVVCVSMQSCEALKECINRIVNHPM
jgi:hypothetical protein